MHHTIEFAENPSAAIATTAGTASVEGFRALCRDVVLDARHRPGTPVLVDHTELDVSELTPEDTKLIGAVVSEVGAQLGSAAIAIVVASPLAWGLARQTEAHANQEQLNVRIFYSREEAAQWLEAQTTPTEPDDQP
jgi:hypothetical protein